MLKHLYIKNFALIDELDIDLHEGFSVMTGETGAGKSIILGAIGLLLGQRADGKSMKMGAEKCVIEAQFDLSRYQMEGFFEQNDIEYDETDTIIRRELLASGKSRAFINDTPVALSLLKELGEQLVDIHSQHQNLLLQKHDFQLGVVDVIADDAREVELYRDCFTKYHETLQKLETLKESIERNRQQVDFMEFQYNELAGANLAEGEQEELEQKSDLMTHAEDIKTGLYEAESLLNESMNSGGQSIVSQLRTAISSLRNIERVYPDAEELTQRMDSAYIELKDISQELNRRVSDIEFDPAELDSVNARLDLLNTLESKYHKDNVEELIEMRDELRQQLNNIENSDEALATLQSEVDAQLRMCKEKAGKLTNLRMQAAKKIEQEMRKKLVPLGMPNVQFSVTIELTTLNSTGQDKVSFLFSANTSTPLQPIAQVASGGEIARVMLSLKAMISGVVKLPTIIFDEIDTGVSGKMAEQMACMMQEMGSHGRQVISITHLPQIAALGTSHYRVSKEENQTGTTSRMEELKPEERIQEIAQMLSGSQITEAAIQNARQLLKL